MMAASSNIAERREFTQEAGLSLQEHLIEVSVRPEPCSGAGRIRRSC
jgi:hypothetical protein